MRNSPMPRSPRRGRRDFEAACSWWVGAVRVSADIIVSVIVLAAVGEGHELFSGGGARIQLGHELATGHHEDSVARVEHLSDLGGGEEDSAPIRGEVGEQREDVCLRTDVDAAGGDRKSTR